MPCFAPMPAVRMSDGSVCFTSRSKRGVEGTLELPCGQCIGCRLERSRQWAMRCLHEASLYDQNCFITLTYDDSNCPNGGSLDYSDFQKFMKRLRRYFRRVNVRFYMCGEYGDNTFRPHFHACLFNFDFPDKVYFKKTPSGERIYTSKLLEKLWLFGLCSVGAVTFQSAAYVARYCVQKVTGDLATRHYEYISDDGEILQRTPEFNHMSLKPGIGAPWLARFRSDVYPRDYVVVNGAKCKPPSYYDTLLERANPDLMSDLVAQRELDMANLRHYDPDEFRDPRMRVKEAVINARKSMLKRSLYDV